MTKAIVLCSGGLDSVVTAYYVKKKLKYEKIIFLFFDYGQRAAKMERKFSEYFARKLKARFVEVKLPLVEETFGDLLNAKKASKISREDLKNTKEESLKWYVPHRNLIFLSYAMSLAESLDLRGEGRHDIFVGFKNEGKESFPDTTIEFVSQINKLRDAASEKKFEILAPLIMKDKEDIVLLGREMGVDLAKTWSCYVGDEKQCGECLACALRKEGFRWANVKDKTLYQMR
ncbi:7-cyano-7-deazaguanine synthase QueC [Candidatus Pacearchaeota archaeon]|nr:7-cyano-7-deazaguanine synthase QueC [Candidatus Pacearchaeota archaeon]